MKPNMYIHRGLFGLCALAFSILAAGPAMANGIWDGGGTNSNWSTPENWSDNIVPGTGGTPYTFAGDVQNTSNNDLSGRTAGAFNFTNDGSAGKTNGFVLNGNALIFGTNIGTTAVTTGSITDTINLSLIFSGTRIFNINGNHHLTLNGNITESSAGFGLTKQQGGILTLSGNNTYTGLTNIVGGTLSISNIADSVSGSNIGFGNLRIGSLNLGGGNLNYTGSGSSTARTVQIGSGNGSSGATISANGANGGTGLKFTASTFNTQDPDSATNNRTLTLTGSNTDANTISGQIQNAKTTGVLNLAKSGTGLWTLGGDNAYTGSTTLNAGTLRLNYGTGGSDTSKLSNTTSTGTLLLNGGTLELSGGSHTETVLSTTLNTGGTFIKRTNSGTSTLSMEAITFTGGAIDFSADSIATTTNTVTNGILSQRATVAGANFAMTSGSDIVAYDYVTNGSTGYTGGAMAVDTNYVMQTAGGANTLDAGAIGATTNTLKIANTATGSLTINGGALTLGSLLFAGSADYTVLTTGAGRIVPGILHNYGTNGATLTLGALAGVGSLTQYGTGKTILTGQAQGTVTTSTLNINGGTVQISNINQIGIATTTTATVTLNKGILLADTTSGDIDLSPSLTVFRNITLGAGGGTLDVIGGNKLTVSGVVSGTGNPLTIGSASSNGSVIFSGSNTYTGATLISGGTLGLGASNCLPDTSAVSIAAASLNVGSFSDTAGTLDVTAAATINVGSGGTLAFASSADVDWTGGTLNVTGTFTPGASIRFGTSAAGLTATQLGLISINGTPGASLDPSGYLIEFSDPYLTWSGSAPFDGDANNDGVQNGLAWLLGAASPSVSALGLLPTIVQSGGSLQLTFSMRNAASRGASAAELQHSSDLGISDPWTSVLVPDTSGGPTSGVTFLITPGSPLNAVQATISSSESAGGKLFTRLKAVK